MVFCDGLRPRVDMKLAVDAGGEVANGAEGDFQFFGDFFMEVSFGEELQDFLLAWGERVLGRQAGIGGTTRCRDLVPLRNPRFDK